METPASFDLNQAIQHWRENLGQSPAFRNENLDEIETHLRDSLAALETRGLSQEEAFLVATKRIGKTGALEKEFGKINGHAVWLDRFLWMMIGVQLWLVISVAYSTAHMIVGGVLGWLDEGKAGVSELAYYMQVSFVSPALLALVLFLGWMLLRRANGKAHDVLTNLLRKPLRLALVFFLVTACVGFLADGVLHFWIGPAIYNVPGTLPWRDIFVRLDSLIPSAAAAAFTAILARKRLRARIT